MNADLLFHLHIDNPMLPVIYTRTQIFKKYNILFVIVSHLSTIYFKEFSQSTRDRKCVHAYTVITDK